MSKHNKVELGSIEILDEAVDLAFKLQQDEKSRCRHLLKDCSRDDLYNMFKRYILNDNEDLLVVEEEGKIVGVTPFYWIDQDNYVSYSQGPYGLNYFEVAKAFQSYIEQNFKGYTVYANTADEHLDSHTFYKNNGFQVEETAVMLVLEEYNRLDYEDNVELVDKTTTDLFLAYTSQNVSEDAYWNATRMKDNMGRFINLIYFDEEIKGHITGRGSKKYTELIALTGSLDVKAKLLKSFVGACYDHNIERIDVYGDEKELVELSLKLGFTAYDTTTCYSKKI